MQQVELTMYGYPDNSPPGNGIEFPGLHQAAAEVRLVAIDARSGGLR